VVADPETPCDELLVEMKRRRLHLAVVEEGGQAVGIVAMEDLVEVLIGEIREERGGRER
jgi:CBS domain containing-hemolysin-like protein